MAARFVIAQVSDPHIRTAPGEDGIDTAGNLVRALDAAQAYKPDLIIATGDLANDARAEEYAALARVLAGAPARVHLLSGNHDDPAHIRAHFGDHGYLPREGRLSYVLENERVRVVALDSTIHGETPGKLGPGDEAWLNTTLCDAPLTPTLVALHHPPFDTHDILFDTIDLGRRDAFAQLIASHPQVQLIVCGHHHRCIQGRVAHAPVVCAPSTAWGFGLALREGQPVAVKRPAEIGLALHVWPERGMPVSHFIAL